MANFMGACWDFIWKPENIRVCKLDIRYSSAWTLSWSKGGGGAPAAPTPTEPCPHTPSITSQPFSVPDVTVRLSWVDYLHEGHHAWRITRSNMLRRTIKI